MQPAVLRGVEMRVKFVCMYNNNNNNNYKCLFVWKLSKRAPQATLLRPPHLLSVRSYSARLNIQLIIIYFFFRLINFHFLHALHSPWRMSQHSSRQLLPLSPALIVKCKSPPNPYWPDDHRRCRDYYPLAIAHPPTSPMWNVVMSSTNGRAIRVMAWGSYRAFAPDVVVSGPPNVDSSASDIGRRPDCVGRMARACWWRAMSPT